jgi:hypothetical protein
MRGYLKEHSGAFDPDDTRILVATFDKAWESVQASGAIFDTDTKVESARAILAKHIIEPSGGVSLKSFFGCKAISISSV